MQGKREFSMSFLGIIRMEIIAVLFKLYLFIFETLYINFQVKMKCDTLIKNVMETKYRTYSTRQSKQPTDGRKIIYFLPIFAKKKRKLNLSSMYIPCLVLNTIFTHSNRISKNNLVYC